MNPITGLSWKGGPPALACSRCVPSDPHASRLRREGKLPGLHVTRRPPLPDRPAAPARPHQHRRQTGRRTGDQRAHPLPGHRRPHGLGRAHRKRSGRGLPPAAPLRPAAHDVHRGRSRGPAPGRPHGGRLGRSRAQGGRRDAAAQDGGRAAQRQAQPLGGPALPRARPLCAPGECPAPLRPPSGPAGGPESAGGLRPRGRRDLRSPSPTPGRRVLGLPLEPRRLVRMAAGLPHLPSGSPAGRGARRSLRASAGP